MTLTLADLDRWDPNPIHSVFQAAIDHANGVRSTATQVGDDRLAVDVTAELMPGGVRVQIKTGTKAPNSDGSITVPVTEEWKKSGRRNGRRRVSRCSW